MCHLCISSKQVVFHNNNNIELCWLPGKNEEGKKKEQCKQDVRRAAPKIKRSVYIRISTVCNKFRICDLSFFFSFAESVLRHLCLQKFDGMEILKFW